VESSSTEKPEQLKWISGAPNQQIKVRTTMSEMIDCFLAAKAYKDKIFISKF